MAPAVQSQQCFQAYDSGVSCSNLPHIFSSQMRQQTWMPGRRNFVAQLACITLAPQWHGWQALAASPVTETTKFAKYGKIPRTFSVDIVESALKALDAVAALSRVPDQGLRERRIKAFNRAWAGAIVRVGEAIARLIELDDGVDRQPNAATLYGGFEPGKQTEELLRLVASLETVLTPDGKRIRDEVLNDPDLLAPAREELLQLKEVGRAGLDPEELALIEGKVY